MPAPKRVELPPRKNRNPNSFPWATWLGGVAVGVAATLSVQHAWQEGWLLPSEPVTGKVGKADSKPQPTIVDQLPIEFYKLLPSQEEEVPGHLISQQIREDSPEKPMDTAASYRLQAGSFQKPQDADRRRASILLLGLETHIQTVEHGGKTWHRVMLGPFESLKHLELARHRLKEHRIDTIVLKLKK